jgi:hypothetical protein
MPFWEEQRQEKKAGLERTCQFEKIPMIQQLLPSRPHAEEKRPACRLSQ